MIAEYESPERDPEYDSPRHYGLSLSHKHIPEMMQVCGLTKKPIFCPIVCDFPQGMLVTVPLHFDLLPRHQQSRFSPEGLQRLLCR